MLADFHLHCSCSVDCDVPPERQVQAALDRGLDAICFTDHVDLADDDGIPAPDNYDWGDIREVHRQMTERFGTQLELAMGVELGSPPLDFAKTDRYLDGIPEIDFIIASQHHVSRQCGGTDLILYPFLPERQDGMLSSYFDDILSTVRWGRFSVLGHMTMPDRYAQKKWGLPPLDFTPYRDCIDAIFRALVETGRGIECNTSRGGGPWLPGPELLCRYRELGGEIITLGSDAHTPEAVGAGIREGQELLRQCGFRYVCTYRGLEPVFHTL